MERRTGWAPGLAGVVLIVVVSACAAPTPSAPTPGPQPTATLPHPTMTPTATKTSRSTLVPTLPPTATASPTVVATAELPPQESLDLPDGLALEAFELAARPVPGEPIQPIGASAAAVLERRRSQRELTWPFLVGTVVDPEAYYTVQAIGVVGDERFYARSIATQSEDRGMLEGVEVVRGDQEVFTIPPETMGPGLVGRLWFDGVHWSLNVMHARPILGTELELVSDVYTDGQSLSQRFGFDEVFNFQLLAGRPFFFYRKAASYGFSYDGVIYPTSYTGIEHNLCCAGGVFNPLAAQDMVAFYAQRGDVWYYVEVGYFAAVGAATPEPDMANAPELYPDPVALQGRGAWVEGQLCPSLNGVLQPPTLQSETVLEVLKRFNAANVDVGRGAADPAYWGRLMGQPPLTSDLAADRISQAAPASASPYADLLNGQCGAAVVQLSWWVETCPEACQIAEFKSPALITHVFLLNRAGHWFVWATYP